MIESATQSLNQRFKLQQEQLRQSYLELQQHIERQRASPLNAADAAASPHAQTSMQSVSPNMRGNGGDA